MGSEVRSANPNKFQGAEQSRPRCKGERSRRKERTKQNRSCKVEEEAVEATTSVRNPVLTLLDKVVGGQNNGQEDLLLVVEENHDSVAKISTVLESLSEFDPSSIDDGPRPDQNPLVAWIEPKRSRKIQTTSLLLRRRKKNKERHRSKQPVLRLRGGAAETDEDRDMKKPARRFSTGQMNTTSNCLGETYSGLQRSFSAPQLSIEYTCVDDGAGDLAEHSNASPLLSVLGGSFQRHPAKNGQSLRSLERPHSWKDWEQDRQIVRPPPLQSPRQPDLAYLNMTVDEAVNEDGIEHYDIAKDAYRRTDSQVRLVTKAQRDQRRVAGGIYQCVEDGKENFYLHIMKGAGKLLGIKLVRFKDMEKPRVEFETFGQMDYERYVQCSSSQRIRVNVPEETKTGFIWYGHGGNTYPLSLSVYKFCERVDNNLHYSASNCERVTQAPGASQLLCSNESCGLIFWHLSVMFFHRVKPNHFQEAGQEHFAVMLLKSKEHVLLWTDKAGNQTRWTRLEHSPPYEKVQVYPGSLQRIRYVVAEELLPQCNFALPAYSPILRTWDEPQPLKRIPSTCTW